MSKKFKEGSVWRKWDLHVHSLHTHLQNNYTGVSVADFAQKILDEKLEVIGLTNYFNFSDDDFTLKAELEKKNVTVFLNLELRLSYQNKEDECCDIHIIFDSSVSKTEIQNFLTHLTVNVIGTDKIATSLNTKNDFDKANVEFEDLLKVLKQEALGLEGRFLIGFLSRGKGNGRTSTNYEKLARKSHFLIHSSDRAANLVADRKFWLEYGKPLMQSSDSHKLADIGSKFTWVKGDPTFEAMRQTLFEPDERVTIQDTKPEQKPPYQVIKQIKFVDKTKKKFLAEPILLNQNLNSVIGGKSTGKSLLLYHIAKAVDPENVSKVMEVIGVDKEYKFEDSTFDFEVHWEDAHVSQLSKIKTTGYQVRKVVYIPQHYLNELSDKRFTTKEKVNDFVKVVVLQQKSVAQANAEMGKNVARLHKEISWQIEDLFAFRNEVALLSKSIKDIGDEKGISAYIKKLKTEIDEIKKKTGLSKKDLATYQRYSDAKKQLEEDISLLQEDRKTVIGFSDEITSRLSIKDLKSEHIEYLNSETISKLFQTKFAFLDKIDSSIETAKDAVIAQIDKSVEKKNEELTEVATKLKPFLEKASLRSELSKKEEILKEEEEKLLSIKSLTKTKKIKEQTIEKKRNAIFETYKNIQKEYATFVGVLTAKAKKLDDILLKTEVSFNGNQFNEEVITTHLNRIDLKQVAPTFFVSDGKGVETKYEFKDGKSHLLFIEKVFDSLLKGDVKTLSGKKVKDAVQKLLTDYFYIDYQISYKKDSLEKMSPGKRGLVLLKILVELSEEDCPIILDQPEDDLDNRSVYSELVTFVKTKKKERQIIIATHNPNLAVGADSENIVVANQKAQEKGRENETYQFEYTTGALENSFTDKSSKGILDSMGIREHVCDILEGGEEAFVNREKKYFIKKK